MKHSLFLAAAFAALLSTSAFARSNLLDETPSPTIVYGELVTVGSAPANDAPNWVFESGNQD